MAKEYAIGETFRQGKVNLKVCEGLCIDCYFFNRKKNAQIWLVWISKEKTIKM